MKKPKRAWTKLLFMIEIVVKTICLLVLISGSGLGATDYTLRGAPEISPHRLQNTFDLENQTLKLNNNELTVSIDSLPLEQVMKELNRIAGIKVKWQGPEITQKITVKFSHLPLDKAISRILRDQSYALFYTSDNKGKKLDTILIVSRSEDNAKEIAIESTMEAMRQPENLANVEEPMSEIDELPDTALLDDETKDWLESVGPLLSEDDTDVATKELTLALNSNANPEVRMMALEALCMLSAPSLDEMIETALNDPEAMVREHAAQCLEKYSYDDQGTADILLEMGQNEVLFPRNQTE